MNAIESPFGFDHTCIYCREEVEVARDDEGWGTPPPADTRAGRILDSTLAGIVSAIGWLERKLARR